MIKIKNFKVFIKKLSYDFVDLIYSVIYRIWERKKFKDKRRVEIYSKINLTEEQKNEIDKLYIKNYGKKIPYTWHKHFTAYTGNFDKNYIPELLYIPEFERYENIYKEYGKVIGDKNFLPILAKAIGIKTPKTIISCTMGMYRDDNYNILSKDDVIEILKNYGEAFCKPTVDTGSGKGCFLVDIKNGIDKLTNSKIEDIIVILGRDFVIQEKIICHKSIKDIYSKSVNTFRVFTYRWKDEIKFFPSIMRIGRNGNILDNAHAGGIFIAIDDDGQLHKTAFTEFNDSFSSHPDTNVKFSKVKIDLFPKIIDSAYSMHKLIPQIGSFNWDFTIDEKGTPILIEANVIFGSIWLSQMAHGKGVFGDDTEEVLQWLKLMNETKASDRYKYNFGHTE